MKPEDDPNHPDYDPNKYTLEQSDDVLPRCPFCPPTDAVGRRHHLPELRVQHRHPAAARHQQVYAPTAVEWFLWLLPGILTVLLMIGMFVWYLFFWDLIQDWLSDSWFEDEKGPPTTYIAGTPRACSGCTTPC